MNCNASDIINAYDVHKTSHFHLTFHNLQYIFGKNEARKKGSESKKMVRRIYVVLLFELY